MNKWSRTSLRRLKTCHPDLETLANTVLRIHDCTVVCGHRTKEWQDRAYYAGMSKLKWPNSKHNAFPSSAIDLAPYIKDQSLYDREQVLYFAGIVLATADFLLESGKMSSKIRWGGDWDADNNFKEHKFFDGIHFELVE